MEIIFIFAKKNIESLLSLPFLSHAQELQKYGYYS